MSSTLFIPAKYCLVADENGQMRLHESIRVVTNIEPRRDEEHNVIPNEHMLQTDYVIDLDHGSLKIYTSHEDNSDEFSRFRGFIFSGFHGTCRKIIQLLGMPPNTIIY